MPPPTTPTNALPVACFAPPLTDAKLAEYRAVVAALPDARGDLRDAMGECLRAVEAWWELPESTRTDATRFRLRVGGRDRDVAFTPLEDAHRAALFDLIPWPYELDAVQALFDKIPEAEAALRDAAFHLLWHARELCLDREPATRDKLPG